MFSGANIGAFALSRLPLNKPNSIAAEVADPLFSNVLLLVHPTGSDGVTTISDVKGNTLVGTTSSGGFPAISSVTSPFSGGKSILFNGNNFIDTVGTATTFEIGNIDFAIEAWGRLSDVNSFQSIVSKYPSPSTSGSYILGVDSGKLIFYWRNFSGGVPLLTSVSSLTLNTWFYAAVTRNGDNFSLYINNNLEATATNTNKATSNTANSQIGAFNNGVGRLANDSYLSEIRVTKAFRNIVAAPTSPFPNS